MPQQFRKNALNKFTRGAWLTALGEFPDERKYAYTYDEMLARMSGERSNWSAERRARTLPTNTRDTYTNNKNFDFDRALIHYGKRATKNNPYKH